MAHLVESMMSVKQTPWHKLGVILPEAPNAQEAIVAAGLDWKIEKRPVYFQNAGGMTQAPDAFAVVRDKDNAYMGYAGKKWQPLQNVDAFRFFDPFIESGEATYETAGSLDGGRRVWVLAKINRDPIEVVKGDVVEKYVLLSNYHQAGRAIRGALTPIRVVCANTEAMAFKHQQTKVFKATHSNRMQVRLSEVQASIAEAEQAFKRTADFYKQFAKISVTDKQITQYVNSVFEYADVVTNEREKLFKEKTHETIKRLFETGRGTDIIGVRGTVWGLYNSVTEYIQHEKGRGEDTRLRDAWFGSGMTLNQRAFESAILLAA